MNKTLDCTQIYDQPSMEQIRLQLLLFVDRRPSSRDKIEAIRLSLKQLSKGSSFELQVIDVGQEPSLAEHFKLMATPALVKISPEPHQTIAGSNLIHQLEYWWPKWQQVAEECNKNIGSLGSDNTSLSGLTLTTEVVKMSDEIFRLKQENQQLQEQLQFKDRIMAMLAHDLRNPLTAASLALETLEISKNRDDSSSDHASDSPRKLTPALKAHLLKQARLQIKSIDRMISDILDSGKGNHSSLQIQPKPLSIGTLCQEVLQEMVDRFEAKQLYLAVDIPNDLPLVYGDPERIRQVLVNLLDNAIKYTSQKGKIKLSILHRTSQKVQITVTDSGPGIPEQNRDRIFEERYRLERDELREGYGIGLFLCQRIICAHYGQIWVDSAPNNGSSFHFTLPVY